MIPQGLRKYINIPLRCFFLPSTKGPFPFVPFAQHLLCAKLWFRYLRNDQYFGTNIFYQSLEKLSLPGLRPSEERISVYKLENFVGSNVRVLDIGCNLGFIDLQLADKVKWIDGFDIDENLITIGNMVKDYMEICNVNLTVADFRSYEAESNYDLIFCYAVHKWVGMSIEDFVSRVSGLLNAGGVVIFESNNYAMIAEEFERDIKCFENNNYHIIDSGYTSYETERKFVCLKYEG